MKTPKSLLRALLVSLSVGASLSGSIANAGWISQGEMPNYPYPEVPGCDVCVEYHRVTEGIHHFAGARVQYTGASCEAPTKTDYAFGLPQEDDQDQLGEILRGDYGGHRLIGRACGEAARTSWQAANDSTREAWEGVFESTVYIMTVRMPLTPILGRACKNGAEHVEMKLRSPEAQLSDIVPLTRREKIARWLQ